MMILLSSLMVVSCSKETAGDDDTSKISEEMKEAVDNMKNEAEDIKDAVKEKVDDMKKDLNNAKEEVKD